MTGWGPVARHRRIRPARVLERVMGDLRGEMFDATYIADSGPWDIDRPQPALLALAGSGRLAGPVLDVGCGTGEHALMAAAHGLPATGVDLAPIAIEKARRKARERGLAVRFTVGDVLDLPALGERYRTALDCGLFHVLDDEERVAFTASLGAVLEPGGRYHLLCFSEHQPGDWGPRRVRQQEIRDTFAVGWRVDAIEAAALELRGGASAAGWLATITRA
ncbi:MAG TPA: class I SAM-dependent methyltransferase [Rugosimonospora sp.]|nr:class I SAM-dependent methyltransferase [Rugosimonospora sp.]